MGAFDVAVVGGGGMGAATAWDLAGRGVDVVLFEQHAPGHDLGSSHGSSRIFRNTYVDPWYRDLASEALPLWRRLEDETGSSLLDLVGGLTHGEAARIEPLAASLAAAGIAHERPSPDEATERWPALLFDEAVLFQPGGGRLDADGAVRALHEQAAKRGADVRCGTRVTDLAVDGHGVVVATAGGEVQARVVVVAAGAWVGSLLLPLQDALPELRSLPPFRVTQEQPVHLALPAGLDDLPTLVHERSFSAAGIERSIGFYGLVTPGIGLKLGEHGTGPVIDADGDRPEPDALAVARVQAYAADWLPGLGPDVVRVDRCLYTTTPDEHFVLTRFGPVVVCSPCSGHGFKFVPAIGRRTADLSLAP